MQNLVIMFLYVNDLLITRNHVGEIESIKREIKREFIREFEMINLENFIYFMGF